MNEEKNMNEKIKAILESMGMEVKVYDGDIYRGEGFDFDDFKQFAEIIIQDCMTLINDNCYALEEGDIFRDNPELLNLVTREYTVDRDVYYPIGIGLFLTDEIETHFGVEYELED